MFSSSDSDDYDLDVLGLDVLGWVGLTYPSI